MVALGVVLTLPAWAPTVRPAPAPGGDPAPAFGFRLPDPRYASRPHAPQAEAVTPHIRWLLHPTSGAPALAWSGDRLRILVAEALAPPASGLQVALEAEVAGERLRYPLRVTRVTALAGGAYSEVRCIVPARVPRESFDLAVVLPDGRQERHARAVRVLHRRGGPRRLAVLADHQLWDPSGRILGGGRHPGAFPRRGATTDVEAMARQGRHELDLLDPDLVLHLGDLVYGLDPGRELAQGLGLLSAAGPATFLVPGNHDGYARYGLDLKASLPRLAVGMVECRRHLPGGRMPGWRELWGFLTCVYGDLKPVLFRRLLTDGLVAWRRTLGPERYAFDLGRFRFLGLNTYDGTAERRHAFSVWVDIRGLHLGAPMVDNYGGYLSVAQVGWLEAEARDAAARGQTLVVFGHHDPRGNPEGTAYHANQPFPTDPVGPDHFEAWNFDGPWDSDPADGRGPESATDHSGHALLRVLARHGGVYLSGHVHRDGTRRYAAGAPLGDGIVTARPVTFLKVTTASAAPRAGGYWGYRLLTLQARGEVDTAPFAADLGLPSVPAGNLWVQTNPGGDAVATVHTALPRPVRVRLRARLPQRPAGYRFTLEPGPAEVELLDVAPASPGQAVYYLAAHLPAAGATVATTPAAVRHFILRARPLAANRAPTPRFRVDGRAVAPGATVRVTPGARLSLDARGSADPEGHALLPAQWEAADGRGGRGARVTLRAPDVGELAVRLTLRDAHGAFRETTVTLSAAQGSAPARRRTADEGAGCADTGRAVLWGAAALVALGVLLILLGRRRR